MLLSIKITEGLLRRLLSTPSVRSAVCVVFFFSSPSLFAQQTNSSSSNTHEPSAPISDSGSTKEIVTPSLISSTKAIKTRREDAIPADPESQALTELENVNTGDSTNHIVNGRRRAIECKVNADSQEWVDRVRSRTHSGLCFTADWIDGLFGDEQEFDGESFRGKVSLGFREDEIEGFDPRLRVRIKTKLPNMSKRFNAFIGRVEEDSYISNTEVDQDRVNDVGLRSTNDDDSEWLIGIGYRDPESQEDGFDVSVGAKLSSGLSPFAKVAHRHLFKPSDNNYWRTTQTVFWRKRDSIGFSSSLDYTRVLAEHDILEWDTSVKYTEDKEKWEWITSTTWHHEFTPKKGISTRAYVRGIRDNPVSIPEFGVTLTYVRPFLREWLYIETGVDFRWERETLEQEEYKSAVRFGIQLEMLLGDYYKLGKR